MRQSKRQAVPPANAEKAYGEYVERGHCKCCCSKWKPVKKNPMPIQCYVSCYWIVFDSKKRCTGHAHCAQGGSDD